MYYFKHIPIVFQKIMSGATWKIFTKDLAVFITFDDGPNPESTPRLLNLLDQFNIKASFFCLGEKIEKYPHLVEKIIEKGHVVANHGYKHLSGWNSPSEKYIENVEKGKELTKSILFRPPYGKITPRQYFKLKKRNKLIFWSLMPGDFNEKASNKKMIELLKNNLRKGEVIVLHDKPESIQTLEEILPEYFKFITENQFKALPITEDLIEQ